MNLISSFSSLIGLVIDLLMALFLLRAWLQYCRADFYNPISQTIVKFSQPAINPLQKFIPTVKNINLPALVIALLLGFIKAYLFLSALTGNMSFSFGFFNLTSLQITLLAPVKMFGKIIFYSLFISAIGSWFGGNHSALGRILNQITAPFLNPIRRIMPRTGMFDFSPMILAFILIFAHRFLFDLFVFSWAAA